VPDSMITHWCRSVTVRSRWGLRAPGRAESESRGCSSCAGRVRCTGRAAAARQPGPGRRRSGCPAGGGPGPPAEACRRWPQRGFSTSVRDTVGEFKSE
jgi:hypothetical protein